MCIYSVFLVQIAVVIDTYMFEVYIPPVTVNKDDQQMHISAIRTYNILLGQLRFVGHHLCVLEKFLWYTLV